MRQPADQQSDDGVLVRRVPCSLARSHSRTMAHTVHTSTQFMRTAQPIHVSRESTRGVDSRLTVLLLLLLLQHAMHVLIYLRMRLCTKISPRVHLAVHSGI
jgi:hypothetical protein